MKVKEINTETKEGKLLMIAIGVLATSPKISLNGNERVGMEMKSGRNTD
jgi:hypothetical protein